MSASPADVIARLELGHLLRMEMVDGDRHWWFEDPDAVVPADVIKQVKRLVRLREFRDSLFKAPGESQTWCLAKKRARR